jgi:hypothetical protein
MKSFAFLSLLGAVQACIRIRVLQGVSIHETRCDLQADIFVTQNDPTVGKVCQVQTYGGAKIPSERLC